MTERIEIPYTEKGVKCVEMLRQIAFAKILKARDAVEFIMPNAQMIEEKPLFNGEKYKVTLLLPEGVQKSVTYDYLTKVIEIC